MWRDMPLEMNPDISELWGLPRTQTGAIVKNNFSSEYPK